MRMTTMPIDTGRATLVDLERIDGKAELIDGRIVRFMPTGDLPGYVGGRIFRKLADHVDALGYGRVWPDGVGFVVPELSSGRESFSAGTNLPNAIALPSRAILRLRCQSFHESPTGARETEWRHS